PVLIEAKGRAELWMTSKHSQILVTDNKRWQLTQKLQSIGIGKTLIHWYQLI
ncbi:hypothetical protein RYX36_036329, partial [Vicia faba]